MYNYFGDKEREWNLESTIRYIRVFGGPAGREGLLVGLQNGTILQIFIDNHFPITLINQSNSIRCLDISMYRKKIAVVDDQNTCFVYDIATKELLYQEPNAGSVAWNTEMEDVLCFAGNGILNVKSGNFPAFQQQLNGFVVGFRGSRVFSLDGKSMTSTGTLISYTLDIPYALTLNRLVKNGDFTDAYKLACLGVPEGDWRRLAMESLSAVNFDVSRKSFVRLRDMKFINLIQAFEVAKQEGRHNDNVCLGDICAVLGKYSEVSY
jgi:intraflagellar transport protein 122